MNKDEKSLEERLGKIEDALAILMTERGMKNEEDLPDGPSVEDESGVETDGRVREAVDKLIARLQEKAVLCASGDLIPELYNEVTANEAKLGFLRGKITKLEHDLAEAQDAIESYRDELAESDKNFGNLREEIEKLRGIVLPHRNQIRFMAKLGVPKVLERDALHLMEGLLGDLLAVMEA